MNNPQKLFVKPTDSILDVLNIIDNSGKQIALVIDEREKLIGLITDGDIRRYLLKGNTLDDECEKCMRKEFKYIRSFEKHKVTKLMEQNDLRNLPVIDDHGKVIEVIDRYQKLKIDPIENALVIMAGGRGKRLMPFTEDCPKPMLKVGGKPILERLLEKSIKNGFNNFYFSVNYLKNQIIDYFENGDRWDVNINYLIEDEPYGTAGSLSLIKEKITKPFVVVNGDVLSGLNYRSLLSFHIENKSKATICSRLHQIKVPFGVINTNGNELENFDEKPTFSYQVNAGMYVLEPEILSFIKVKEFLDMPDLLKLVKQEGNKISVCPIYESWLDIGHPETYKEAEENWNHY